MDKDQHSSLSISELVYLVKRYQRNELTHEEEVALNKWIARKPRHKDLFHQVVQLDSQEAINFMLSIDTNKRYVDLTAHMSKRREIKKLWQRVSIAASFVLVALLGTLFYYNKAFLGEFESLNAANSYFQNDDEILFIDGRNQQAFPVEQSREKLFIQQLIDANSSQDISEDMATGSKNLQLSKVITPRGKKVKFYLDDGTFIYLNANSEISFSTNLKNQSKREVWLNGEAYFEVLHNESPFVVHSGEKTVEVMGTAFNVDSFMDNSYLQVGLLEGSVMVSGSGFNKLLNPGNQFTYSHLNKDFAIDKVSVQSMALWLNDIIRFKQKDIQEITKRLSRWYNVEFVFDENPPESLFTAELSLKEGLVNLLEKLELTKKVRFEKLSGNKVSVHRL